MPTTFNCSMCSAPLDLTHVTGATVRCRYCGNSSILPEELRDSWPDATAAQQPATESFVPMIDQAMKLAEIARLAKAGNKIAAIKLYRETFGTGLKEAKDAVEQLDMGQPVVFTQTNFRGASAHATPFPQSFQPAQFVSEQTIKRTKRVAGFWLLFIILIPLGLAVFGIVAAFRAVSNVHVSIPSMPGSTGKTSAEAPGFASAALEFGSEGIGPKQFKDARSIAVDGQGRIYVAEFSGGRIQVFDSGGNFLTQWMADQKKVVLNLAADRKGVLYVVHPSTILRYDAMSGNLLGEVAKPDGNRYEYYSDAFIALDGSLYAIGSNSNIIHVGADNQIKSVIKVAEKVGSDVRFDKVAVDGLGNIYALDDREYFVYKFAPDGRFVNKFGGKGREPGQLDAALNLAVDGQGRVYVSVAGRGVEVFDSNGRYINSFGGREVIFGIAVTDHNEILATERNSHKIAKYVLSK